MRGRCGPLADLTNGSQVRHIFAPSVFRFDYLRDRHADIAEVEDVVAKLLEGNLQTSVAYGARSHIHASAVLAKVHRYTEYLDPAFVLTITHARTFSLQP
jgi:hypothetical protein